MRILSVLFALLLSLTLIYCQSSNEKNIVEDSFPISLGDPFIMLHGNTYSAYGTNAKEGIEVYTSDNLIQWKKVQALAFYKDSSWGGRWFWAPDVYYVKEKNKFFMYYSADEHICVATADSPLGPFVQDIKQPMIADEKCIDNSFGNFFHRRNFSLFYTKLCENDSIFAYNL